MAAAVAAAVAEVGPFLALLSCGMQSCLVTPRKRNTRAVLPLTFKSWERNDCEVTAAELPVTPPSHESQTPMKAIAITVVFSLFCVAAGVSPAVASAATVRHAIKACNGCMQAAR